MRLDIPLLPLQVDIRRRTLPPFRLTIWKMMLAVVIASGFFAAWNQQAQLVKVNRYHAEQMYRDSANSNWHLAMLKLSVERIERFATPYHGATVTIWAIFVVAILGRLLNRIGRNAERQ